MKNKAPRKTRAIRLRAYLKTFLTIKLTVVLLLLASINVTGKIYAQEQVTLSIKNGSLETILKEINKQTGYLYIFQDQWKGKARKIDISVKNAPLEEVLAICFKEQPFTYTIIKKTIIVTEKEKTAQPSSGISTAPPEDIHGKVVDENNEPVPGVTVTIKGSKKITSTDSDGGFSFNTSDKNVTLVFSSLNTETFELKVAGESEVSVRLKSKTKQLGEVSVEVNTGYQRLSKERSTGSYTHVNSQLLNQQVSTDIISRLDPISNGLTVNRKISSAGQIMIRGLSTINGPRDPLIVVDNFPFDGNISNINPNDVESVTILKDAAAASIWGTKAGNGVIVITTKKGKMNQPFTMGINSNVTFIGKPDLFYLKKMPTSDFIDVEQFLFFNQYRFRDTARSSHLPFSEVYEILFKERNGQITPQDAAAQIDALRKNDVRNEFLKYMYRTAINQQYSVYLKGGSKIMSWYFSGGFDKNLSNLYEGFNRLTLKLENTYHPIKSLQLTTGIYFINGKNASGRTEYGSVSVPGGIGGAIKPYTKFSDVNGNALPLAVKFRLPYIDTLYSGKLLDWNYYPLEDYKHAYTSSNVQDVIVNLGINYSITKDLSIDLKYQYLKEKTEEKNLHDPQSFLTRDLINLYTQVDPGTGQVTNIIPLGSILDLSNNSLESHQARGQVNFNKNWSKHSVVAIAGGEIRQLSKNGYNFRTYGYNDDILTSSNVDFANYYPTLIGFGGFIPNIAGFSGETNRIVSLFSNAAYTYDEKYTLSLSGRRDGSNLFGATTNNKWKPLWSSGLSWLISKENFYNISSISYLKLRATYGFSGNVDPTKSGLTAIGYLGNSPYTNTPRSVVTNFYDPNLKWENVRTLNVGFDFSALKNRLSGSIEYYQKKSTDLLATVPLDYTTGLGSGTTIKNSATLKGNGMDVAINSINVNKAFKWTSVLNFNINKDHIAKYYSTTDANLVVSGLGISGILDRPVFGVYSYRWAGLDPGTGDPMGYIDGKVSKDYLTLTSSSYKISDLVYNGPVSPTIFGSLGNSFFWKDFSISVYIAYKFGYYFRKSTINYADLFTNANGHLDYVNRWQKPGDEKRTNVPSMVYPNPSGRDQFYTSSQILVDKGDNIRLQYINLSYDFAKSKYKIIPVKELQLYIYINNLGILWRANKDSIDPDYQSEVIPPSKNYSIGLRANF